ncbi:MAG: histidine kinase [Actinomycetota bacterium]
MTESFKMKARNQVVAASGLSSVLILAFLGAVFVGVAAGSSQLGAGRPHLGISIAAIALVAWALEPLKRTSQRFARGIVYRTTTPPPEVITDFTDRIARYHAGEEVPLEMARILAAALKADNVAVWLWIGGGLTRVASHPKVGPVQLPGPAEIDPTGLIEIRHGQDLLGAFEIDQDGRPFSPQQREMLENLASVASIVLRNVRLRADLQSMVDDVVQDSAALTAARRRLVKAQDAERRALERNIHDGAQQHLTALGIKIALAKILIPRDPPRGRKAVADAQAMNDGVLGSIAELTQGLYPKELVASGVTAALESTATRLPMSVRVHGTDQRYPAEVEAAIYFTCLEALQNAAKHAKASSVRIHVKETDGSIGFTVADDGAGFDVSSARGAGLQNMADRMRALQGSFEIDSRAGVGTVLSGRLPL